jgi:hypothetical protein
MRDLGFGSFDSIGRLRNLTVTERPLGWSAGGSGVALLCGALAVAGHPAAAAAQTTAADPATGDRLLERLGRDPIRSGIEKPDGLVGPNLRADGRQDIEP